MLVPTCTQQQADPQRLAACRRKRRGATAMEYMFIISLILIVAFSAVGYLGQTIQASFKNSSSTIEAATTGK